MAVSCNRMEENRYRELVVGESTGTQLEAAVKHAKKALSKEMEDRRHQEQLAFAALARKGYSPDTIRNALHIARVALEEQEADGFPS